MVDGTGVDVGVGVVGQGISSQLSGSRQVSGSQKICSGLVHDANMVGSFDTVQDDELNTLRPQKPLFL